MDEVMIWLLLVLGLAGGFLFSERTKNRELLKLHRLLFKEKDYDAFCSKLETVSCIVLFSRAARVYMLLNAAITLGRHPEEVEELFRQSEHMKMSKRERTAFEQKRREWKNED